MLSRLQSIALVGIDAIACEVPALAAFVGCVRKSAMVDQEEKTTAQKT